MGRKSKSKSSSVNKTTIDNSNTVIEDVDGPVLNLEGAKDSSATFIQTETDFGAVKKAFNFGEDALDSVDSAVDRSLDTVDDTVDRAFDFGGDSQDRAFDFGEFALTGAKEFSESALEEAQETSRQALSVAGQAQTNAFAKIRELAESFTSSSTQNTRRILMVAVAGALILGAITIFRKGR